MFDMVNFSREYVTGFSLPIRRVLVYILKRNYHHCKSSIRKQTANLKGTPKKRGFSLERNIPLLHFSEILYIFFYHVYSKIENNVLVQVEGFC